MELPIRWIYNCNCDLFIRLFPVEVFDCEIERVVEVYILLQKVGVDFDFMGHPAAADGNTLGRMQGST